MEYIKSFTVINTEIDRLEKESVELQYQIEDCERQIMNIEQEIALLKLELEDGPDAA